MSANVVDPFGESPFRNFLDERGIVILDGGLATSLEALGYDLDDDLWSAKILLEAPGAISGVHTRFLQAGADCITAGSYQASLLGFEAQGLGVADAERMLLRSVSLATDARDTFWNDRGEGTRRLRPIVAASVGPYGAYRADGSEYRGAYGLSNDELLDFHSARWRILDKSPADILACETIPSLKEVSVLLELLRQTPDRWAWMSVSCRDGEHLSDGTPVAEMAKLCDAVPRVAAVGINCTCPEDVSDLISALRSGSEKPIIVYPNAGGRYHGGGKGWSGAVPIRDWATLAAGWRDAGASVIGGCCRVGAVEISSMRRRLLDGP